MKKWFYLVSFIAFAITMVGFVFAIESQPIDSRDISALLVLTVACIVGVGFSSANQVEEYDSLVKKRDELKHLEGIILNINSTLRKLVEFLNGDQVRLILTQQVQNAFFTVSRESVVDMPTHLVLTGIKCVHKAVKILGTEHKARTKLLNEHVRLFMLDVYTLNESLALVEKIDKLTADQEKIATLRDQLRFKVRRSFDRMFEIAELGLFIPANIDAFRELGSWRDVHDKELRHYLKSKERYWAIRDNELLKEWYDYVEEIVHPRPDGEGDEDTQFPAKA